MFRSCCRNLVNQANRLRFLHHGNKTFFKHYSNGFCHEGEKNCSSDKGTLKHWKKNFRKHWSKAIGFSIVGIGAFASLTSAVCETVDSEEELEEESSKIHENYTPLNKDLAFDSFMVPKKGITRCFEKVIKDLTLEEAIHESLDLLYQTMEIAGAPGLAVGVTVDGRNVWSTGLGYADVENKLACTEHTVMRIASISKPLTMMAVARLWEEDRIDLDVPVQSYVTGFPRKMYGGKEVTITTRQLLSHQGGIRHYRKKINNSKKDSDENGISKKCLDDCKEKEEIKKKVADEEYAISGEDVRDITDQETVKDVETCVIKNEQDHSEMKKEGKKKKKREGNKNRKQQERNEFDCEEYFIKQEFSDVESALKLFQDDDLFFIPGTGYLYTTHGWTLVSAVVESAAGQPFAKVICKLFHDLGLNNTYLDQHQPIIYNRARYYIRNKHSLLINAPYVDNSFKWAGGGFLSTVGDLTKFGNAVLYSYQRKEDDKELLPGILKASTVKELWKPKQGTKMSWDPDGGYGFGWGVVEEKCEYGFCRACRHYVSHTGGAVGASSVLLILPPTNEDLMQNEIPPKGVVVALLCNMQAVRLNEVGLKVAKLFERVLL